VVVAKRAVADKIPTSKQRQPESLQRIRDVLARPGDRDSRRTRPGREGDLDVAESFRTARVSVERVTRDLERLRRRARSLTGRAERPAE
jgi:hypothetical protein